MSNYKFILNEEFKKFEYFLCNIKQFFKENSNTIHKARNELKVIEHENQKLVVKYFKIPYFIIKLYIHFSKNQKHKNLMNMH